MSTIGVSPVTVTVSSTEPDPHLGVDRGRKRPGARCLRANGVEPGQRERDGVGPPRSCSSRYCPEPSVTTVRTFSISAGLDASTVTPGSTAPEASVTTRNRCSGLSEDVVGKQRGLRRERAEPRSTSASDLLRGASGGTLRLTMPRMVAGMIGEVTEPSIYPFRGMCASRVHPIAYTQ